MHLSDYRVPLQEERIKVVQSNTDIRRMAVPLGQMHQLLFLQV